HGPAAVNGALRHDSRAANHRTPAANYGRSLPARLRKRAQLPAITAAIMRFRERDGVQPSRVSNMAC
ncbi:MAG: hypothetical protein KJO66_07835, partial [Gammaproteobacteria bacterium]|nr:hypothetical protein [Gammaproteobacteria bacterium]